MSVTDLNGLSVWTIGDPVQQNSVWLEKVSEQQAGCESWLS